MPPEKIEISRLPVTGAELFGRQKELELLDEAWASDDTNVVSLVAWGGVGKSTLVNKWLERMAGDNYRGARRVYAWSFYSQGTGERVTSADLFINNALLWFGDTDPTAGSPWDKGERLARLAQNEKTLLLLDGGSAHVFGHDVAAEQRAVRRLVNRVSVEASFFKRLSAAEKQRDLGSTTRERTHTTRDKLPQRIYVVKSGDTLGSISEKVGVSVERLQELNPNLDQFSLVAGQKIKIR